LSALLQFWQTPAQLRLAVVSRRRQPQGFHSRDHTHAFHELGHVVEGEAWWTIGGRRLRLRAGDVVWVPAGALHREDTTAGHDATLAWVGFDFDIPCRLPPTRRRLAGLGARGEVTRLYDLIQREQSSTALGARERAALALRELLILYARAVPRTADAAPATRAGLIAGAVAHSLQENLAAPLSLAALARYHGVTPAHLARLFQRERGLTPCAFLRQARLDHARALLHDTNLPLKAIAAACGFTDAPHLSHAFKAATGTTPARWRKNSGHVPGKTSPG
jgi:AraC-like DNA-binding protein